MPHEAGFRGLPVGRAVGLFAGAAGEQAQQVVQRKPAHRVLDDQVRPGQAGQPQLRGVVFDPAQCGRGANGEIRARVQAEQPEQPRILPGQLLVGDLERGPDLRVPAPRRDSRCCSVASSCARPTTGQVGWAASSCPAIRSASGSRPQNRATSATAVGSAAARCPPRPASIVTASSWLRTSEADPLVRPPDPAAPTGW